MPIPDFQDLTLPLLELLKDGEAHDIGELRPNIAAHFKLTAEELSELMIDHGIGVTEENSYVVKRIDSDYFSDE